MRQFNPVYPGLTPIVLPRVSSHQVFITSGSQTNSTVSMEIACMAGSLCRLIARSLELAWPWLIIGLSGAANAQSPDAPAPPVANPLPVSPPATARESQLETRVRDLETILQAKARREAQLEDRLRRLEELSTRPNAPSGAAAATAAPPDRPRPTRGCRGAAAGSAPKSSVVRPLPAVR